MSVSIDCHSIIIDRTEAWIILLMWYPLNSLSSAKDIGQVFVDVACAHRWLYDVAGILHRDLSPDNIMCRWIDGTNANGERAKQVCGVLTDYDLPSWTKDLKQDCTRTSQQRTGTPPYMAQELLTGGTSPIHLYRHDLESLFYVMLLTCGCNNLLSVEGKTEEPQRLVMRQMENLPYKGWFGERNYLSLGNSKVAFFSSVKPIQLSKCFEDFRPWLKALQYQFTRGVMAKSTYLIEQDRAESNGPSVGGINRFDEETLGGHIHYASFIEPVPRLTGGLAGLIIRYNPPQSLASAGS